MRQEDSALTGHKTRPQRMTGIQRREQLLEVGRALIAARGIDNTSVEEIASQAGVSKPLIYEHFGGKEGLYAVIVDREIECLMGALTQALTGEHLHPRTVMERAALALLTYIETHEDGFRILVRDSPVTPAAGTFCTLLSDAASSVEEILVQQFSWRNYPVADAELYAQMLVGMVAYTGQWWLENRSRSKEEVAARMVNLSWFGLSTPERHPEIRITR